MGATDVFDGFSCACRKTNLGVLGPELSELSLRRSPRTGPAVL